METLYLYPLREITANVRCVRSNGTGQDCKSQDKIERRAKRVVREARLRPIEYLVLHGTVSRCASSAQDWSAGICCSSS